MARTDDLPTQISNQNGKKVFLQKISYTQTGAATAIAATDIEGNPIEKGALLCLQSDQDFHYQTIPAANATSVTVIGGARPGTLINADLQEFVNIDLLDGKIDVIGRSASGTLVVYHVR
jgi:hypothetical protein